ncbi:MAG: hypothetical protein WAW39_11715 [Prosthecobacter sp.]
MMNSENVEISYDIDELLKAEQFLLGVHNVLPDLDDDGFADLTHEEKVLSNLAEYQVLCGGGFSTLVQNMYFGLLEGTLQAAKEIEASLLFEGLTELWNILEEHGFPRNAEGCYDMSTEDVDMELLDEDLNDLNGKYFSDEPSLWRDPEYHEKAKAYVLANIEVFRKRKKK